MYFSHQGCKGVEEQKVEGVLGQQKPVFGLFV
jgi:hypothetical protein